jgi:NAD(P)-dependent dehydrogenase (short-subunit alcohol dehydrogenase family)
MSSPVWFITGSSKGIGRALAEYAISQGYRVVATARKIETLTDLVTKNPENVLALTLNVTSKSDIFAAIDDAMKHFGRIDVVVNNAGYGVFGPIEVLSNEEIREQMETNFFGALFVTQAVIPIMREQKSGAIIQISSVCGTMAITGFGMYSASKFALEAFSEALAQEVASFGIKVLIVEPGAFRTSFVSSSMPVQLVLPKSYLGTIVETTYEIVQASHLKQPGNPCLIGPAIDEMLRAEDMPLRIPLGSDSYDLMMKAKLEQLESMKKWEKLSRSTDCEEYQSW